MSTAKTLLDTMIQGAVDATEANLQLQQEWLLGLTRLLPGFSARPTDRTERPGDFRPEISNHVMSAARAQRKLLNRQFDAAISAFDQIMDVSHNGNTAPTAKEAVAQQAPAAAETDTAPPVAVAAERPPQEAARSVPREAENIAQKVAIVTGAASGIGEAVALELANRNAKAVLLVDRSEAVQELARTINEQTGRTVAVAKVGDTTDEAFRKRVFNEAVDEFGIVTICVPAAGITRDALSVRVNKETGRAELYPIESFRQVTEVNLLAPIYWGIEMVARIAEDRAQRGLKRWEPEETIQGVVVFLGSVSSQGNKGQISYAVAKAGLEGAAATLTKEAIFHGVRCGIIHPGFTDTPMARALGDEFLNKYVLPFTQLRRLIRPDEIADAICFMISNSAVSGELWADAGWHPPA